MSKDAYRKKRILKVPVGDDTYYARTLVGDNVEEVLKLDGEGSLESVRSLCFVLCLCACDENGARLFSDDDLPMICAEVDLAIVTAVSTAVINASGLGDDDPGKD